MRGPPRQSLLVRLLGVYLLFTVAVLAMGFVVNLVMQRQLRADAQAADLALGQAIARDVAKPARHDWFATTSSRA